MKRTCVHISLMLVSLMLTCVSTGCVRQGTTEGFASAASSAGLSIVPLVDGSSIFSQTEKLLAAAHTSIFCEMYEIGYQPAVKALLAAKLRGVQVFVITDPSVAQSQQTARQLVQDGLQVRFLPIPGAIDHVKLLIIDDQYALIGGMNHGAQSYKNHDADVLLQGDDLGTLPQFFQADWQRAEPAAGNGNANQVQALPSIGEPASLSDTVTPLEDSEIGQHLVQALQSAMQSIHVEMYTLTSRPVLDALIERHKAGVQVEVIVDPGQKYNQTAVVLLRAAGIPVRSYPTSGFLLHMKLGIIDQQEIFIGSANWTHSGLDGVNHEMDVQIFDDVLAGYFSKQFDADFRVSH
ncbi:MAG: phospholipase D/Transphosphatidylase [Bacilli bacterium]|nr:phospholipase D/Transphosphatidylase [Bacilli bacterium]